MKRSGASPIEIIVVVTIIAVFSILGCYLVVKNGRKMREDASRNHLVQMRLAIRSYKLQQKLFPSSLDDLVREKDKITGKPYLTRIPLDPLGMAPSDYGYDPKNGEVHSRAEGNFLDDGTAYKDY